MGFVAGIVLWIPSCIVGSISTGTEREGGEIANAIFWFCLFAGAIVGFLMSFVEDLYLRREEEVAKGELERMRKCPKCGASGNIDEVRDHYRDYESVRVQTSRIEHFDNDGNNRGYSEHEVEVPVMRTRKYIIVDLSCPSCSHKWSGAR